ncbi:MAG TPA: amidohydrolase/deacetylase family metallohydrolase [Methylomirabilota bacterium]|jgi:dihydroorotase|nr:amidohydrolase/deacetylase family metallohydrolase [Methylomirabilota bacterium]
MGLLLRGGHVIDPAASIDGVRDVRIRDGLITEVGAGLAPDGDTVEDVAGRLVLPGLIDLHAHCFVGGADFGPRTDDVARSTGVTTWVDGGSTGAGTFEGMREWVLSRSRVRMFAFLNISAIGLVYLKIGELNHLPYADVDAAIGAARDHADIILGIKVRNQLEVVGGAGLEPLKRAVRAADAIGGRVMLHCTNPPRPLGELLALLRPGDIVSHFLHGRGHGCLDASGHVSKEVRAARERGVLFDVAHGRMHVNFPVVRAAFAEGFYPDTISSDLTSGGAAGCVKDLPTTMGKFLSLGMPLVDVVRAVTAAPAAAIGRSGRLGTLKPGAVADVAVMRREEGEFDYEDAHGQHITGRQRFVPTLTLRAGEVWWRRPVTPA